ncbi:Sac2 family-domain-containing protein [Gautieria morchelliformis]|nr:Sac2 family-domain-containing protein [Gautieria morchelliformis]
MIDVELINSLSDRHRAKDFVELHEQVETSIDLLDSLESFLSTFQHDLSAVSGQISNLQDRSKDIENRLKGRRKIERPLSNLISEISIPPLLAETILDNDVGEPWLLAVPQFELRLDALKARPRVKAVRSLAEVAEGLRIVAATKIRVFFLALFRPIRSSMSTNMQVIQTSILLKFRPLFLFLQRHAPPVASEVQRAYIGAARVYYETGFRRYARSLGWIKARVTERSELLGASEKAREQAVEPTRLANADLDGPSITLSFMADDKSHKVPIEGLFRSLLLVLMDNGTAEYAFITRFFDAAVEPAAPISPLLSPRSSTPGDNVGPGFSGFNFSGRTRAGSVIIDLPPPIATPNRTNTNKEQQGLLDGLWKQVMDPALEYCQTFTRGALDPAPPVVPLLTMIRLLENVLGEVQKRDCPPLETFTLGLRLSMWPAFQKEMNSHLESVKKLADGAGSGGFLSSKPTVRDATVAHRYAVIFTSFITLTENEEETMIFSNLIRLRGELTRLIIGQSSKIKDPAQSASYQSNIYEMISQALSAGPRPTTHPKAQMEIAYWREREEEARRRTASARR